MTLASKILISKEIGDHREFLKNELWRHEPRTCIVCGHPMRRYDALDMHEGILKRGDTPSLRWQHEHVSLLFNLYNCVLIHHECHMQEGQLPALRDRIIKYKTNRYGGSIKNWLKQAAEAGLLKADELLRLYFAESIQSGGL